MKEREFFVACLCEVNGGPCGGVVGPGGDGGDLEDLLVGVDVLPLLEAHPPLLFLRQVQVSPAQHAVAEPVQRVPQHLREEREPAQTKSLGLKSRQKATIRRHYWNDNLWRLLGRLHSDLISSRLYF